MVQLFILKFELLSATDIKIDLTDADRVHL